MSKKIQKKKTLTRGWFVPDLLLQSMASCCRSSYDYTYFVLIMTTNPKSPTSLQTLNLHQLLLITTLVVISEVCMFFFFSHFHFPASGQAVVTGVVPSPPRFLPSIFIAHRVQQSHCSSIFHRVLLTHALALSASQFVHKKKSQRIYTSMHLAGLKLTKLTYTRPDDNLIRHRGCMHGRVLRTRIYYVLLAK